MNQKDKPNKQMLSIRIPSSLNEKLESKVKNIGISKSSYVLCLLDKVLREECKD